MKRIFKRIFIGLMLTIVLVLAILAGGAYIYRDKIAALVLAKINEQVTEPVVIKGGVRFSLIKNFPFASITLTDVSVKNKFKGPEYLLNVHELSCLFNIRELINSNIQISRIHINDGEVNICMDARGTGNFDIFKPSTDTATSTKPKASLNLKLSKAVVKNVHFTYLTENREEDIRLKIEKLTLGGDFNSDSFDLETSEKMIIEQLRLNGDNYLSEKAFKSDITINVDQKRNKYTLNKANIEIAGNNFDVTGHVVSSRKNTFVNIVASAKSKDIAKLIALVPVKYKSTLEGAEGSGAFVVGAKVYGNIRRGVNPDITVSAKLDKGEITIPRIRKPLKNVALDAYYHRDAVGNDELLVKKFHSEFDGQPQNFDLRLDHLSNPDFVFNADGVADLHDLRSFLSDTAILQSADGLVTFQKFHIEGSKDGITDPHNPKFKASGNFSLKDVNIKAGGLMYGGINGSLDYNGQDIDIKGFTMNLVNTDIEFDGKVTSILAYALSRNRSAGVPDVPLGIDGSLRIKNFDIGKLIAAYTPPTTGAIKAAKPAAPMAASAPMDPRDFFNIKGHLDISIDKFQYKKMVFGKIQADLGFSPHRLDIYRLSTHTMEGDVTDTGYVAFTADRRMIFALGLAIDKVDLPTVLKECDNFGQTALTDRNLKGKLTAYLDLYTVWNNYTDIDLNKLVGNLSCTVLHGELNNFAPIRSAAAFIKIDELNHIVFSDLSNQVTIRDRVITIPMMEVQSSAINLMMAGTHTFDNVMDYQIKVNLRKLLAAKFGRKENDDAYIEDNPYEGVNLYLTITGDMDHPKIKYDKKAVKGKLKSDLAAQKEELKDLFGKDKHKKTKGAEEVKREEKYYDTRKKPEFIDFQEDSVKSN
jgi:hypothetical protein